MQFLDGGWTHSAHDLTARMGCDHRIALDLAGQAGLIDVAATQSPVMLQLAKQHGDLHEGRVLESAPPAELFCDPKFERTKQFLARVSEAGRL